MKKFFNYLTYVVAVLGFLSFSYYCSKFYTYRGLEYDEKYIPMYIVVFLIISANFIICIINSYKIEKQSEQIEELKQQNEDLRNLVIKVFDKLEEGQDNILSSLYNSREIPLDIYEKLQERD